MKKMFALAVLASFAAAPAMAESFTRDGVTYDYKIDTVGSAVLINGTASTGKVFRLRVKGDRVSGHFGDQSVQFRTSEELAVTAGGTKMAAAK